jgi:hypothetical protein
MITNTRDMRDGVKITKTENPKGVVKRLFDLFKVQL